MQQGGVSYQIPVKKKPIYRGGEGERGRGRAVSFSVDGEREMGGGGEGGREKLARDQTWGKKAGFGSLANAAPFSVSRGAFGIPHLEN